MVLKETPSVDQAAKNRQQRGKGGGGGANLTAVVVLIADHNGFIAEFIAFSAKNSANQTQDLIDSKLGKR